jgi:hypothetical protein
MNRGIDNYNLHHYHNAEDDFEMCCAMAPGMSRCYSYVAITKMQLNERQATIDAFRTSYSLDPFGTYGRYAKQCLIVLAGDEAIRTHAPVDSTKILDSAMSHIDKQSSDNAARHFAAGNAYSSARSLRPNFDSQLGAVNARTEAALKAANTVEAANNLKHLLAVKKMPGDANLRAWGTTLTTRYYGDETYLFAPYYIPRERPMELKAIVKSMNALQLTSKQKSKSMSASRSVSNKTVRNKSIIGHGPSSSKSSSHVHPHVPHPQVAYPAGSQPHTANTIHTRKHSAK